jgi:hypothetical protein
MGYGSLGRSIDPEGMRNRGTLMKNMRILLLIAYSRNHEKFLTRAII